MLNQKANTFLGVLIGIGIVLLLGGAYYFGTQKNQSTSIANFINNPLPSIKTVNEISSPTNSNPESKTLTNQGSYITRADKAFQTGPHTYACFPDEVISQKSSDLIGFKCNQQSAEITCDLANGSKLTSSSNSNGQTIVSLENSSTSFNKKIVMGGLGAGCKPAVITINSVVYVKCDHAVLKLDFNNESSSFIAYGYTYDVSKCPVKNN